MGLPRYLVSIDVFKATAIVIVLALHTLSLSGLSTERNGALLAFEMMSGLFYELAGLGTARSVCRALSDGQPKRRVLSRLLRRGLMLVGASILLRGLTIIAVQYGLEPLLEEDYERAARWARWHVGELLQRTVFDLRALTFHGACQLLAAPLLLTVLHAPGCDDGGEAAKGRQRVASGRSAMALLGVGLLVLALTPWLRSQADAATCCVPDHATLGYSGKCDQDAGAIKTKLPPPGTAYPSMRVPDSCLLVVGDGSAPSTFDPCDFTAIGSPYLPPCAEGEAPPDWPPCERAAELSEAGGASRSRGLCEIYPDGLAPLTPRTKREIYGARKRCLGKLQALSSKLQAASLEGGDYARGLLEGLDSVSLGTIWCPLVVSSNATKASEGPSRVVVATIQGARPYFRSLSHTQLSKEDITHLVGSPLRMIITWALTVLFGLHGLFACTLTAIRTPNPPICRVLADGPVLAARSLSVRSRPNTRWYGVGRRARGRGRRDVAISQNRYRFEHMCLCPRASDHQHCLVGRTARPLALATLRWAHTSPLWRDGHRDRAAAARSGREGAR